MYVYKELGGATIVGFGVSLTVTDCKATVEYNGMTAAFEDALRDGKLEDMDRSIQLDKEQMAWLDDSRTWVKHQLEDSSQSSRA